MIYELECPDCFSVNEIESDSPVVSWSCQDCKAEPVSSLPTDENGDLIPQEVI